MHQDFIAKPHFLASELLPMVASLLGDSVSERARTHGRAASRGPDETAGEVYFYYPAF
jgi:hypothetical protein